MIDKLQPFREAESHLAALTSGQWSELEQIVERFEMAWQGGATPSLADYLPLHSELRFSVLCELAATDLEWRWRRGLAAATEDYLSQFPELCSDHSALVRLATCEYCARRRAGSTVDPAELLGRFPSAAEELRRALAEAASADSCETPPVDEEHGAISRLDGRGAPTSTSSSHRPSPNPSLEGRGGNAPSEAEGRGDGAPSQAEARGGCAPSQAKSQPGERDACPGVGRYEFVRVIGSGSFGTVYEAVDRELGRRVAVKLPRNAVDPREEGRARFVREAHHLARLSHPAIVPVLDAGWSDGAFYIVCSLVEGPTLADRLRDGPLEQAAAAHVIATIADALEHAHRQGVVHRDVKPSNILFDARGSPWLTDFGLASRRDAEATLTVEGQLLGTPAYMAPEQAAGAAHRLDGRSDVYSLGAVLYECLTGQLPFLGSPSAILDQLRVCDPLPPARLRPQLSRDLEMICLKALEKRPADRYPTAAALADDLCRYLAGEPTNARPPGPTRRLVKWARRRPATAALAATALAAMLTVTSVVWWHNVQLRGALTQTDEARRQAETLRLASQQSQRQTRDLLYAADLRLANNAYLNGDRLETLRRLRRHVPIPGESDQREFAWRRLWSLCHADERALRGHSGDVYAAQFVRDGRQLVSAGRDGKLLLWTLSDNGPPELLASYADELNFVAVAGDGNTLAVGSDNGTIHLWNLAEKRQTGHFVGHSDWALCGAISPQGDQLATAGRDRVIRLWLIPGGSRLAELTGHTSTVESLSYLPDGKSLVSTGTDGTLRLWDLASQQGVVLGTHPLPACCVACSHDGKSLATGCVDCSIYVWDVASRRVRGRLNGHTEIVQSVAFSPDDRRLASAGKDGTVRIWDMGNMTQAESFMGHSTRVWSVAWFPDGASLASAGAEGTVRFWHRGQSRLERVLSLPTEVTRVRFSARDMWLLTTNRKGAVWMSATEAAPVRLAVAEEPLRVAHLARDADIMVIARGDYDVRLCNSAGQPLTPWTSLPVHLGGLALSPAGDLLAVGGREGKLNLYQLPEFHLRWSRSMPASDIGSVEFTWQADKLVVVGTNQLVAVCNVADGSVHGSVPSVQPLRATLDPGGRLLATAHSDRAIRIWNAEKGTELTCLQGHDGAVQAIAFSPDGRTLAAGTSAGSVALWHVASWQELGRFTTSLAAVRDLAFSPRGETLAIGGRTATDEGQVVLWETKAVVEPDE